MSTSSTCYDCPPDGVAPRRATPERTRGLWRDIGIGLGIGLVGLGLTAFTIKAGGGWQAETQPATAIHHGATATPSQFVPGVLASP